MDILPLFIFSAYAYIPKLNVQALLYIMYKNSFWNLIGI